MSDAVRKSETRGIILVFLSYVIWGLFPLYWCLLEQVPPVEISLHRMVWCAILCVGIMLWRRRWENVRQILASPRLIQALFLSGSLVAVDWTFYIWGVASHQLIQTSLGLFITPLVSILLGMLLLGEKVSPMRALAVLLGIVALAVQIIAFGHMPWIALGISLTFGLYGYVRKETDVDPLDGLLVETGLLAPLALVALIGMAVVGKGYFRLSVPSVDLLLILGGAVTATPLALFVTGARSIRLTTVGFVQYFSPAITLALAVFGFNEHFSAVDGAAFVCLWCALVLVAVESHLQQKKKAVSGG